MNKIHNVEHIHTDDEYLHLTVDGKSYRVRWSECSPRLTKASMAQRNYLQVSPSG